MGRCSTSPVPPSARPSPRSSLENAQPQLESEASEATESLASQPAAFQAAGIDLNGRWFGVNGGVYNIVQQGSAVAITESDTFGNITAYGEGTFTARTFDFDFTTAAFTAGIGSLTLDD